GCKTGMSARNEIVFCFFFQAEDGIRDRNVTGVQTCALPISSLVRTVARAPQHNPFSIFFLPQEALLRGATAQDFSTDTALALRKIGRASCREREDMSVGAV